ncbi:NAD-dependent epimerase/dehydratase family protein [Marinifilum sp.]|uniref:NAD-dependent epimerase/dehydratase family protein n=1 Tax=Marinifilum sp. TaxID=2033137 RepID=UPI003BA9B86D
MKNIIITGATGMVGAIVLKHCLESNEIDKITSFVREPTGIKHPKLNEIIVKNFLDYSDHLNEFQNVRAVYFCIGVYTGAVPDTKFKEITVDYTCKFADALKHKTIQS